MLLMTYLLPSQIISYIMDKTSELLNHSISSRIVVLLLGFLITGFIIMSEAYVLKNYERPIENIVQKIINIPKLLKK
jgi:ABC-type sulfate transport system permease component